MRVNVLVLDGAFDLGLSAVLDAFQTANELIEMSGLAAPRFEVKMAGVPPVCTNTSTSSLPAALKIRGGVTKYVLKRAVRSLLPHAVLARPKQGFRVPLPEWLRGELAGWARHQLRDASIHRRGLFRREEIERVMWVVLDWGRSLA